MRRALVLAGGGLAGIAWETGVLRGVADEDPALAAALEEDAVRQAHLDLLIASGYFPTSDGRAPSP